MQFGLPVVLFIAAGSAALAQAPHTAQAMPCREIVSIIASQGAVVLRTGPNTYDRFVGGPGGCPLNQFTEPAWIKSADRAQCFIGYRCRDTDLDNGQ
ncbi:hypothetical protein DES45_102583 [Microvirga subterranea]|uniref:YARHG domain-containing protein n=1 Tax=Microvirga subterranea TaxID=186651 RepID=A0A370HRQ3_9HYPH|nr:hypothetical protein DES45_102583 [Microvirga subterranea]